MIIVTNDTNKLTEADEIYVSMIVRCIQNHELYRITEIRTLNGLKIIGLERLNYVTILGYWSISRFAKFN